MSETNSSSRAIWKGHITFGFVEIPVELRPAVRTGQDVKFHFLDGRSLEPVAFRRVNRTTGKEVPWKQIVRGYEYEKGRHVVVTDDELKHANVKAAQTVDIVGFVELAQIDPFYFDKPYYLVPLNKQSKGYVLLRETLRATGKAGVAKVALRTRQHMAAVIPHGDAIALVLLRFADELVKPSQAGLGPLDLKSVKIRDAELKMAEQVVDGMLEEWDPSQYHDEYRDHVLKLVARKARTGRAQSDDEPAEEPTSARGSIVDLMPLLKKSVEAAQSAKNAGARRRKAKGA